MISVGTSFTVHLLLASTTLAKEGHSGQPSRPVHSVVSAARPGRPKPSETHPNHAYKGLLTALLGDYDRDIIPMVENGQPVKIIINYPLVTLVDIHADSQLAEYVLNEYKTWFDDRLTWKPEEFENRTHLHLRATSIWLPTTSLYNSFDNHQILQSDEHFVLVQHTGECQWNRPYSVQATCALDLRYFPFDAQDCQFFVSSPFYSEEDLVFVAGIMKTIGGNAEWIPIDCMLSTRSYPSFGREMSNLDAIVRWKRNYVYYVMVLVVPTFLISIISLIGIFTAEGSVAEKFKMAPARSRGALAEPGGRVASLARRGAKIGLGLANLLAMSVMLGIVADNLPKSAELTLLGNYLIATLVLGAVAVIVSVVIDFLVYKVTKDYATKPPMAILYKLLYVQPRPFRSLKVEATVPETAKKVSVIVLEHLQQMLSVEELKRRDIWADREWVRVMGRVEFYLIVTFQIVNIGLLIWFLSYASWQDTQFAPFPRMNSTIAYYSGESIAFPHKVTRDGVEISLEYVSGRGAQVVLLQIIQSGYRGVSVNETAFQAFLENEKA